MGGYGSTRWSWHTKKTTVEECRKLSVFDFGRDGLLDQDIHHSGAWIWRNVHTGESVASLGYELNTQESTRWLRLYYTITDWQGDKSGHDYKIHLQTTRPLFGGLRWWFTSR